MTQFSSATLPARVLGALIDYLVVSGLFIALSGMFGELPDGVIAFLSGGLYFSVANSKIAKGQSIGKALLGLSVIRRQRAESEDSATTETGVSFLSIPHAAFRYLANYGVLVLLAEIPPALYREKQLVAPSWILELNMFFAFSWFFANCAQTIVSAGHRGFHDIFVGSRVVRLGESEVLSLAPSQVWPIARMAPALAAVLAWFPWWFGIQRPPQVEKILEARYPLEQTLDIRVMNAQATGQNEVLIEALLLNPDGLRSSEGQKRFTENAINLLQSVSTMPSPKPQLRFRLYIDPRIEPLTKTGEPLEVFTESDSPTAVEK